MENNIFTAWEWYCQYNQEQIILMRKYIFNNFGYKANINEDKKEINKISDELNPQSSKEEIKFSLILDENTNDNKMEIIEEEEDYILGLA